MAQYIQKRRNCYYALLDVPVDVRHLLRRRYVKSLGTDSLSVAKTRVGRWISLWKSEIAAARQGPLDADLLYWRKALADPDRAAKVYDDDWPPRDVVLDALQDRAEEIERGAPGAGVRFYKRVTSELIGTLEHLEDYLASTHNTERTVERKRADVTRMAQQLTTTKDVTRAAVRGWCDEMAVDDGLQPRTISRILSGCRGYWHYLEAHGIVADDVEPFDRLHLSTKGSTRGATRGDDRQPFEATDVVKLLQEAATGDPVLADLICVASYTGARIEELCQLRVENVTLDDGAGGHFNIENAKTKAGDRTVPIHPALLGTLARLCEASVDGWVLPGLKATKYGHRSNAIGKRFTTLKRRLGFGPGNVFHSIRMTFVTLLENHAVPQEVIADLVGHERPGFTSRTYSGGASLDTKRAALAKLSYPTDA